MNKIVDRLPWDELGPLIFLLAAGGFCFLLPVELRKDILPIVVGAALTRVRVIRNNKAKE